MPALARLRAAAARPAGRTHPRLGVVAAFLAVVVPVGTALAVTGAAAGRPGAGTGAGATRLPDRGWPLFGGDPGNTRYSPLSQIGAGTVGRLAVVWTRSEGFGQSTWESFPVVVGRTMYITTSTDAVWALNAVTGARRWTYLPRVGFSFAFGPQGSYFPANRGVAVAGGRVFELTFDDHLLALDAATGRLLWRVRVASPRQGYYETTAPAVWDGLVFAGSSGGDSGARGFVAAYDAATGRQVWRHFTVPAPGHGWVPAAGHHGGGAVWMPPVVDYRTGILYAATGNPSPDFTGAVRPGADPQTDGILALRARTGRQVWFTSLARHDERDHDAASPVVLLPAGRGGGVTLAAAEAGKSGRYDLLSAATGRRLFPSVRFVPTAGPGCPGELGGSNYAPVAYSPRTHAAYISGISYCTLDRAAGPAAAARHRAGTPDLGGTAVPTGPASGTFSAVSTATGRLLWRRALPSPMLGGALATAGGLEFAGSAAGVLYAFDGHGRIVWRDRLAAGFGSAPISYAVGGRQYLAVVSGGAAISAINQLGPVGGRLVVFALRRGHSGAG